MDDGQGVFLDRSEGGEVFQKRPGVAVRRGVGGGGQLVEPALLVEVFQKRPGVAVRRGVGGGGQLVEPALLVIITVRLPGGVSSSPLGS